MGCGNNRKQTNNRGRAIKRKKEGRGGGKWRFAQDIPIGDANNNTGYFQP